MGGEAAQALERIRLGDDHLLITASARTLRFATKPELIMPSSPHVTEEDLLPTETGMFPEAEHDTPLVRYVCEPAVRNFPVDTH